MRMENQKKAGAVMLISEKIDLKITYNERQRILRNNQGVRVKGRYNNCKYICTLHRSTSIYKEHIKAIKKKHTVTK